MKMGFFSDLLKWIFLWVLAVLLMFFAVCVFLLDHPITTGIAVIVGFLGLAIMSYAILKRPSIDHQTFNGARHNEQES